MDGLMPEDVPAAAGRLRLLKFLTGALAGTMVALIVILLFIVLTAENPPIMTAEPVFDPPPGLFEAGGNPKEDWTIQGGSAVKVISVPNPGQVLPDGVEQVIVYATTATTPGQHRSSEVIDVFDSDKPCGNPCVQTKLQMNSRVSFYENSCVRAIAVGDGMVSSGIAEGSFLIRARPVSEFRVKAGSFGPSECPALVGAGPFTVGVDTVLVDNVCASYIFQCWHWLVSIRLGPCCRSVGTRECKRCELEARTVDTCTTVSHAPPTPI
jgi:hypothetical protein